MNTKYKYIWDVYVFPDEANPLMQFISNLNNNGDEIRTFTDKCLERLKDAFYNPVITIYPDERYNNKEVLEVLDKIEKSRNTLILDLLNYGHEALDKKIIDAKTFMDFEGYVYDFKTKWK